MITQLEETIFKFGMIGLNSFMIIGGIYLIAMKKRNPLTIFYGLAFICFGLLLMSIIFGGSS